MPSQNLMVMQTAINRIAIAANGFVPRIGVDGGMGPSTASATFQALVWVAQKNCLSNRCVPAGIADTADMLIAAINNSIGELDQTVIMQRNVDISRCLNSAADVLGVTTASAGGGGGGTTTPTKIQTALTTLKQNGLVSSISNGFRNLAPWQKAVVAGAGVLAAIFTFKKLSK